MNESSLQYVDIRTVVYLIGRRNRQRLQTTGTSPTRRSAIVLNVHDMRDVPGIVLQQNLINTVVLSLPVYVLVLYVSVINKG